MTGGMLAQEHQETEATGVLDEARVEAFAGRLFELYTGGLLTYMVDIGHRTGLFAALAGGPATSAELAARADLQERDVREWLGPWSPAASSTTTRRRGAAACRPSTPPA
jgi:hypothetical protein